MMTKIQFAVIFYKNPKHLGEEIAGLAFAQRKKNYTQDFQVHTYSNHGSMVQYFDLKDNPKNHFLCGLWVKKSIDLEDEVPF